MSWPPGLSQWKRYLVEIVQLTLDFVAHFWRELAGLGLLALGLVTAVSLLFTSGPLAGWHLLAVRLLGWGLYPTCVLLGIAGALLMFSRWLDPFPLRKLQMLGMEICFFAGLGLLHLLAAREDMVRAAAQGRGGGFIGWVVAAGPQALLGRTGALVLLALVLLAGGLLAARLPMTQLRRLWEYLQRAAMMLLAEIPPERAEAPAPPAPPKPAPQRPAAVSTPRPKEAPAPAPSPSAPAEAKPRRSAPKPRPAPPASAERDPVLPPMDLLRPDSAAGVDENGDAQLKAEIIIETLAGFGIPARVVDIHRGPTVTQFGIEPGYIRRRGKDGREILRKVRVSKIYALANDLALALAASPIRIEAPVPGRPYVGIEVPNSKSALVSLRGVMESEAFTSIGSPLAIALGRDVSGEPVAVDLAAMPHLLIAGATGSGKSVCINSIVTCLLMQNTPDILRLLLIDPKRVELVGFNGVPHLIAPVVVDLEQVVGALQWVTREMDARYKRFADMGVRHLNDYNQKALRHGEEILPYLVVVIDELADLMMAAPDQVEQSVCRIAQMARATGIHLVIATQRPSVDVVTGLIKANFPARIAFAVTSQVDSRVILDTAGAEKLLGRGDMLLMTPDSSKLRRLQGCYVSDKEIRAVVRFWQKTYQYEMFPPAQGEPTPAEQPAPLYPWEGEEWAAGDETDPLFDQAVALLKGKSSISTSYLQRALRIGYPRAARLMDLLEEHGYVGPNVGGGRSREVLRGPEE